MPLWPFPIILKCMSLKFLFLGEITGRAGIAVIKNGMAALREKYSPDYIIANGEGTTNGFGLGKAHAVQLSKLGIDLITGGEKLFYKVDLVEFLPKCNFILRAANLPQAAPGKGIRTTTIKGKKVVILNLMSTSGFSRVSVQNPFTFLEYMLPKLQEDNDIILVQFHTGTTAEAATMGHYLKGKAAAVIGTHSKVLTADAAILDGTAFISDNGRCGSALSVNGFESSAEIHKFMTGLPERSHEAWDDGEIQGVLVEVDDSGKAVNIEVVKEKVGIQRPEPAAK